MPPPLLSIIIPVYNASAFLPRCLESLTPQGGKYECILVDDASTDDSFEICRNHAQKNGNFKVIQNKENQGSSLGRKTGLDAAAGQYILFVDADDWLEKDRLENLLSFTVKNNYDFVYGGYFEEYKNRTITKNLNYFKNEPIALVKSIFKQEFNHCLWNKLVKREIYKKVKFPVFSWGEDRTITIQTLLFSASIAYYPVPFYHYRNHPASQTNNPALKTRRAAERKENLRQLFSIIETMYPDSSVFEPEMGKFIKHMRCLDTWQYAVYDAARKIYHKVFNPG
jgi:glycosyltransferase involved in cell wall biosynthesis